MIRLKFVVLRGSLVLRISEGKMRLYKSASHLLVGNPNIDRHWSDDRERFSCYAASYSENNKALSEFKQPYLDLIKEHPEFNVNQVSQYFSTKQNSQEEGNGSVSAKKTGNLIEKFLEVVIEREKVKQGCNFEIYHKLLKKCRKTIKSFSNLTFQSIA